MLVMGGIGLRCKKSEINEKEKLIISELDLFGLILARWIVNVD
jgi:hypothetical protein